MTKNVILLTLILLLGFALRAVLVPYGLPFLMYEDESIYLNKMLAFGEGDFNPHYFKKPTFFLYFHFGFLYVYYLVSGLAASAGSWAGFETMFWQDPTGPVTMARIITLVFSVLSIGVVFDLGRRVFSLPVGVGAAFLMAVHTTHIKFTPILISDIPSLFFILLTAWLALSVYEKGRTRDYLLCGAAIGLAMSFKYNFFSAAFLVAAHVLRCWPDRLPVLQSLKQVVFDRRLWLSLCGAAVLFVTLSPYVLLSFDLFFEHVNYERDHMLQRTIGIKQQSTPFISFPKLLFKIMPRDVGWPLHIVSVLGVLVTAAACRMKPSFRALIHPEYDWKKGLILLAFPVLFFLVICQFRLVNAKYLLPIVPFLFIMAMMGIDMAARRNAGAHWPAWVKQGFAMVLVLLLAQPMVDRSWTYIARHTQPHTLHQMVGILGTRLVPGDRILLEKHTVPARSISSLNLLWPEVDVLQMGHPETLAETVDQFQPDYVLVNPKPITDGEGQKILMFPGTYYQHLRKHFVISTIRSPYGEFEEGHERVLANDYLGVYQALEASGREEQHPGPVLLLLKRR